MLKHLFFPQKKLKSVMNDLKKLNIEVFDGGCKLSVNQPEKGGLTIYCLPNIPTIRLIKMKLNILTKCLTDAQN